MCQSQSSRAQHLQQSCIPVPERSRCQPASAATGPRVQGAGEMVPRVCRMGQAFGRVRRRAFGWTEQQHWQECQQCWQGRQLQSSPPIERQLQQIDWPVETAADRLADESADWVTALATALCDVQSPCCEAAESC